jgi:hypothetical protein
MTSLLEVRLLKMDAVTGPLLLVFRRFRLER